MKTESSENMKILAYLIHDFASFLTATNITCVNVYLISYIWLNVDT